MQNISEILRKLNATVMVCALAAGTVLPNVSAFAATDGTLAATSTGMVGLSVTKPMQSQISSVSDVTLATYTIGEGDKLLNFATCIYSSTAGGGYTVKAMGSGVASVFTLDDGAGHILPYSVVWNSGGVGALGTTGATLTSNVTSSSLSNAATDSATCTGASAGPTAQINVNVLGTALDAAPAGTYTGTLTFLVTPS